MKKETILFITIILFLYGVCFAEAPHGVGGFVLEKHINEYKEMVKMETAIPIRHQEYLHELEIKEIEGFKTGYISFGNCSDSGRIVRIKLKYLNSTKKFYNLLLKRFKKRFGEPLEWRGDPFHIVIAWKWSFTDNDNNRISLILQHNTKDQEEKMGNSVKISMTNKIEGERLCYEKKFSKSGEKMRKQKHAGKKKGPVNWNLFVPR